MMPLGDAENDADELEAALASMLPEGVEPRKMSLEAVAKRAELNHLYDSLYRSLSLAHAHPSLLSLASIWNTDNAHETKGVLVGPERGDEDQIKVVLGLVCSVMFNLAEQWGQLLSSSPSPKGRVPPAP